MKQASSKSAPGARELIAQLEEMEPGDDHYDAKVTVLGENIDHHVKEEHDDMFPKAKKAKVDLVAPGSADAGTKAGAASERWRLRREEAGQHGLAATRSCAVAPIVDPPPCTIVGRRRFPGGARRTARRIRPVRNHQRIENMSTVKNKELDKEIARVENRDPISGAPGSHPVGTGVGAAVGGAAAGAAAGTVVGPLGTVAGAAVGAIVGGLAGKGVAEAIDPTSELAYWRGSYKTRPYADKATDFVEYEPAYGYGVAAYTKYPGRKFDELDSELSRDWNASRGDSTLPWDRARFAAHDAWDRVDSTRR